LAHRWGQASASAASEGGGDFADGVIAFEGSRLGGQTIVSFDRQAVKLLQVAGLPTHLAGSFLSEA
jgi:predicted nucleic-acid-binding protein